MSCLQLKLDSVHINFEYPEDREYFANLLTGGDVKKLEKEYNECFDFRHFAIKRYEFGKIKKRVLKEFTEKYNGKCQLKLSPKCDEKSGLEVDHIIPLATNELNKKIRGMKRFSSAKIEPQSFGSNHSKNLTLGCHNCNNYKRHRFIFPDWFVKG
ncbi:MAG: hypothetical protein PHZ25_04180 [Candidatus Pacebacteria bacterium]|nr:hypothetical protein [Candidatus Paceibacterota bacterium]